MASAGSAANSCQLASRSSIVRKEERFETQRTRRQFVLHCQIENTEATRRCLLSSSFVCPQPVYGQQLLLSHQLLLPAMRLQAVQGIAGTKGMRGRRGAAGRLKETSSRRRWELLAVAAGYESGQETDISPALSFSPIDDVISIGTTPRTASQIATLSEEMGVKAIVCLETQEGLEKQGVQWEDVKQQAEAAGMMAIRMPMDESNVEDQAMMLPQTVVAVGILAELGYSVLICCNSGDVRAPLAALGYLTFVNGDSFDSALLQLRQKRGSIQPPVLPWEQVRERMSAGNSKRVLQLTQDEFRRRLISRKQLNTEEDWQVALNSLVRERFGRQLSADLELVQELQKAALRSFQQQQQQQVAAVNGQHVPPTLPSLQSSSDDVIQLQIQLRKSNDRAADLDASLQSAKDRIEFFFRQLTSLKERERIAQQAARTAEGKAATLTREVDGLKRRVAAMEEREKEMEKEREGMKEALQMAALQEQKRQEMEVVTQVSTPADSSDPLNERVAHLEAALAAAEDNLRTLSERNVFLMRHLSTVQERESKYRAQVRAADSRYAKILQLVEELTKREATAKEAASAAMERFEGMSNELKELGSVEEITVRIEELTSKVGELQEKEKQAEVEAEEAMKKVTSLTQQLEDAVQRERSALENEQSALKSSAEMNARIDSMKSDLMEARRAAQAAEETVGEVSKEVVRLRARESEADEAIKRCEKMGEEMTGLRQENESMKEEINAASQKISVLSEQINQLTRREEELQQTLQKANDHISFLSGRVEELIEAEEKTRGQLEQADGKVKEIAAEMGVLSQRESLAQREAQAANRRLRLLEESEAAAVEAANKANDRVESLFGQISEYEQREMAARAAAKAAYERLAEMSQKINELESDEGRMMPVVRGSLEEESSSPTSAAASRSWDDAIQLGEKYSDLAPLEVGRLSNEHASAAFKAAAVPSAPLLPPLPSDALHRQEKGGINMEEAEEDKNGLSLAAVEEGSKSESVENDRFTAESIEANFGTTVSDCVALFVSQVKALREREVASKEALAAANNRIEVLSSLVAKLADREWSANSEAETFASEVTGLVMRIGELNDELEAAEAREAELADLLTGGGGGMDQILSGDPRELIEEFEAARRRADELAMQVEEAQKKAENISQEIFNARKQSLEEQQEREQLVVEVLSLKDAMASMKERDEAISVWKQQLLEQASYFNALVDDGQITGTMKDELLSALREIQQLSIGEESQTLTT